MAMLQRVGPRAGHAGGLLLFLYWNIRARDLGLPWWVTVPLALVTMTLLAAAIVGYQLAQGTARLSWIGWGGAAAVLLGGFGGSLTVLCAGLAVWGYAVVRCDSLPRVPGLLLMTGASTLFVVAFISPGFGRAHADLTTPWRLLMGAALVIVAAALADLDPRVHGDAAPVEPPPSEPPGGGDPWLDEQLVPASRGTRG